MFIVPTKHIDRTHKLKQWLVLLMMSAVCNKHCIWPWRLCNVPLKVACKIYTLIIQSNSVKVQKKLLALYYYYTYTTIWNVIMSDHSTVNPMRLYVWSMSEYYMSKGTSLWIVCLKHHLVYSTVWQTYNYTLWHTHMHVLGALAAWLLYCLENDDTTPPDVCREMLPPEEACRLNWTLDTSVLNPTASPTRCFSNVPPTGFICRLILRRQ